MRLSVSSNLDTVLGDLDRFVAQAQIAMPRALNKLREQAQVAAAREIASIYRIGVRTVLDSKYLRISLATPSKPEATIRMGGPGFPISLFSPRKAPGGISVQIKGRRFVIPHAFLATMRSGHVIVGARGAYGGKSGRSLKRTGSFGRFIFGRGERVKRSNRWGSSELPINEFLTFSLGDALANRDVIERVQDRIEEQAAKVIKQEIAFASRGA